MPWGINNKAVPGYEVRAEAHKSLLKNLKPAAFMHRTIADCALGKARKDCDFCFPGKTRAHLSINSEIDVSFALQIIVKQNKKKVIF